MRRVAGYDKRAPKFQQVLHPRKHEAIIPLELWRKGQKIKARNKPTIEMRSSAATRRCRACCGAGAGRR